MAARDLEDVANNVELMCDKGRNYYERKLAAQRVSTLVAKVMFPKPVSPKDIDPQYEREHPVCLLIGKNAIVTVTVASKELYVNDRRRAYIVLYRGNPFIMYMEADEKLTKYAKIAAQKAAYVSNRDPYFNSKERCFLRSDLLKAYDYKAH